MNNYERIKNMTVEEMAELLNNKDCESCSCDGNDCAYDCYNGIKQWLLSESEEK